MEGPTIKGKEKIMLANYKKFARLDALRLIEQGYEPESLVHFVEYPQDSYLYGKEYLYISTPLPAGTDLAGHLCSYYTLGELAWPDEEE